MPLLANTHRCAPCALIRLLIRILLCIRAFRPRHSLLVLAIDPHTSTEPLLWKSCSAIGVASSPACRTVCVWCIHFSKDAFHMAHRHHSSCHSRCLGNWHLIIWRRHRPSNRIDWLHEASCCNNLLTDDRIHAWHVRLFSSPQLSQLRLSLTYSPVHDYNDLSMISVAPN